MGYILNFQNNSNNMKNEIIRKITSLTLMTIMFAGGMTLAIPGFLPDSAIPIQAFADQSTTVGALTVSSTAIQGAQVLQVTVNDPATSDPSISHTPLTMDFNSSTLHLNQMTDGSWVAFVVDDSHATYSEASTEASIQFGTNCAATLTSGSAVSFGNGSNDTWISDTDCTNPGTTYNAAAMNAVGDAPSIVKAGTTSTVGPSLNGQTGLDLPQWPIVTGFELSATNVLTFGDDTILVDFGPEEAGSSLTGPGSFVTQGQQLELTIDDNGLNIDPTTAETWTFTTSTTARTTGATTDIDGSLGQLGFGDNGVLSVTDSDVAICAAATSGCSAASTYVFVETGSNTGVFTVHDSAGESTLDVKGDAGVDEVVTIGYGGNSVTFAVATNNASASLDAGADWAPGEAATYTVTDPDMNKMASSVETLKVQDDNIIPTILVGYPKTLIAADICSVSAQDVGLNFADVDADTFGTYPSCADMGDGSKRVKLTTTAGTTGADTVLTINTNWDASTFNPCIAGTVGAAGVCADGLVSASGSNVLSYDICSITDYLNSTVIAVTGDHAVGATVTADTAFIEEGANVCAGEIDETEANAAFNCGNDCTIVFTITHASATAKAAEYVIAMDLNNFAQGVGADSISRIAAVETGPNTGVFEGSVTYNLMHTTTMGAAAALNLWLTAADSISTNSSDVTILLDNYKTGSSGIEVTYGDTDVLGGTNVTVSPPRLDATTHNGVLSWDQVSYAVGDAATVTVVDADLNTDSSVVEIYLGDGTYTTGTDIFAVTCDDAACTSAATIKLVEDGPDSDTFVGVFTVTDDIGEDMEIGYRDSRDANGVATIWYATATIGSTTGTISLDRQVYPVPFDKEELMEGDNTVLNDFNADGTSDDDGDVKIAIQVTDPDETGTTIAKATAPVTIKLITSGTTETIGTAGGTTVGTTAAGNLCADAVAGCEYGPLTEIEQGSNVYEITITLDETQLMTVAAATHQILGGQTVIQVTYADPNGDNGLATSVYDSSIFDLRNGSLTTDKSVYVMGQTMVITITDPDLDLDSATAETYSLGLIEWDSSADSSELLNTAAFTKNPSNLEETGDSTGVFQTTVDIPTGVSDGGNATALELGE